MVLHEVVTLLEPQREALIPPEHPIEVHILQVRQQGALILQVHQVAIAVHVVAARPQLILQAVRILEVATPVEVVLPVVAVVAEVPAVHRVEVQVVVVVVEGDNSAKIYI